MSLFLCVNRTCALCVPINVTQVKIISEQRGGVSTTSPVSVLEQAL